MLLRYDKEIEGGVDMFNEFKLIRVDNRLIHAQIILKWVKNLNINHIIVVDNEIARNPFLSQVFKLTTPPSLHIEILTDDEMIQYYFCNVSKKTNARRTMIIMKSINTSITLVEKGVVFNKIQIGNTPIAVGKKTHFLHDIKKAYYEQFSYLNRRDIIVYYQRVPEENKVILNNINKSKDMV